MHSRQFNVGSDSGTLEEAVSELETQMINDALAPP